MPRDAMCVGPFPPSSAEIPSGLQTRKQSILNAMKAASQLLVRSMSRDVRSKIPSAFKVAASLPLAVWLAAAASPKAAQASIVTITITGTVSGGEDQHGYFIPAGSVFAGQNFLLTYTFNDQKGAPGPSGNPAESTFASTPSSNPGTAVLVIGGKEFAWGVLPVSSISSSILKFVPPYSNGNYQVNVGELYGVPLGGGSTGSGSSAVQMSISPAAGTVLTTHVNWEASFSNWNLLTSAWGHFGIVRSVFTGGVGYSDEIDVQGYLYPTTITVVGPTTCSSANVSLSHGGFTGGKYIQYMQALFAAPDSKTLPEFYEQECGFESLNWQQQITVDPGGALLQPNDPEPLIASGNVAYSTGVVSIVASPSNGLCKLSWASCSLIAPPSYYDPPSGGYVGGIDTYPFYYPPQFLAPASYCTVATIPGLGPNYCPGSFADAVNSANTTFAFFDAPLRTSLPGDPAATNPPTRSFLQFTTSLVGVSTQPIPGSVSCGPGSKKSCTILYSWNWNTTFNGKTGGVSLR